MKTENKNKPAHEIRLGSVRATLWMNRSEKSGAFYSVTFSRLYKSGDIWKQSTTILSGSALGRIATDAPSGELVMTRSPAISVRHSNASHSARRDPRCGAPELTGRPGVGWRFLRLLNMGILRKLYQELRSPRWAAVRVADGAVPI